MVLELCPPDAAGPGAGAVARPRLRGPAVRRVLHRRLPPVQHSIDKAINCGCELLNGSFSTGKWFICLRKMAKPRATAHRGVWKRSLVTIALARVSRQHTRGAVPFSSSAVNAACRFCVVQLQRDRGLCNFATGAKVQTSSPSHWRRRPLRIPTISNGHHGAPGAVTGGVDPDWRVPATGFLQIRKFVVRGPGNAMPRHVICLRKNGVRRRDDGAVRLVLRRRPLAGDGVPVRRRARLPALLGRRAGAPRPRPGPDAAGPRLRDLRHRRVRGVQAVRREGHGELRILWRPGWRPWRPVAASGGPGGPGGPLGGPGGPWRPAAASGGPLAARGGLLEPRGR
eukprot:gene3658-biopygen3133